MSSIALCTLNESFHSIPATARGRHIIMYNLPLRKLRLWRSDASPSHPVSVEPGWWSKQHKSLAKLLPIMLHEGAEWRLWGDAKEDLHCFKSRRCWFTVALASFWSKDIVTFSYWPLRSAPLLARQQNRRGENLLKKLVIHWKVLGHSDEEGVKDDKCVWKRLSDKN